MSLASDVTLLVAGDDITDDVLYNQTHFELQMNGVPGSFTIVVRDPQQTHSFTTGAEILLTIDGKNIFGGYVNQVSMGHMAPAADTSNISTYELRTWTLRGTDYNIIFDRRIIRNTSDFLSALPQIVAADFFDGELLISLLDNYTDTADFTHNHIDNIIHLPGDTKGKISYFQQGTKLRDQFQQWAWFAASVWYIDADKDFHWEVYETHEKRWGFSDTPNYATITTSPDSYQNATIGFNTVEATEDGSYIENDIFIWGGSPFASSGTTVFSRATDSTSITDHGRWQYAETHFGETLYMTQASVDAQSDAFLNGPPGADIIGQTKGLKYPQYQYTFSWFADRVPTLSGAKDHLIAGDLVNIELSVFSVNKKLPLRSLEIAFPEIPEDGTPGDPKTYVEFTGTFGLQLSDPFTLWRYLLQHPGPQTQTAASFVVTVTNSSTSTVYGAYFQGSASPATGNGATTLFTLPFGYIPGTLLVYIGGILKTPTVDYTESDNEAGEFTMAAAPASGAAVYCLCQTLAS